MAGLFALSANGNAHGSGTRENAAAEAQLREEDNTSVVPPETGNVSLPRLRSYGVLEFIDLRFFELIRGRELSPKLRMELVLPP